jgi:hypothetical protein
LQRRPVHKKPQKTCERLEEISVLTVDNLKFGMLENIFHRTYLHRCMSHWNYHTKVNKAQEPKDSNDLTNAYTCEPGSRLTLKLIKKKIQIINTAKQ